MDQIRFVVEWIGQRKWLSLFVLVLVVSGAFATRHYLKLSSGRLSEPIQRGRILDAVYGIGSVMANKRFSINPLVANTLRKTFVKEGDKIKKGMPLVLTDDGNTISAPFDGVVNYAPYRPGENAYTTSPMMVLTDLNDLYIVVSMEQQGALRVKEGQSAKISIDSLRQQSFEGKVAAVYSYTNNFLARIDSIHLPLSVLPDMTCDVAIVISEHENALLIPVIAFENGKVWVKRGNGLPKAVPIKIGVVDGSMAEVLEGDLQPGDRVMIRDQVGS